MRVSLSARVLRGLVFCQPGTFPQKPARQQSCLWRAAIRRCSTTASAHCRSFTRTQSLCSTPRCRVSSRCAAACVLRVCIIRESSCDSSLWSARSSSRRLALSACGMSLQDASASSMRARHLLISDVRWRTRSASSLIAVRTRSMLWRSDAEREMVARTARSSSTLEIVDSSHLLFAGVVGCCMAADVCGLLLLFWYLLEMTQVCSTRQIVEWLLLASLACYAAALVLRLRVWLVFCVLCAVCVCGVRVCDNIMICFSSLSDTNQIKRKKIHVDFPTNDGQKMCTFSGF